MTISFRLMSFVWSVFGISHSLCSNSMINYYERTKRDLMTISLLSPWMPPESNATETCSQYMVKSQLAVGNCRSSTIIIIKRNPYSIIVCENCLFVHQKEKNQYMISLFLSGPKFSGDAICFNRFENVIRNRMGCRDVRTGGSVSKGIGYIGKRYSFSVWWIPLCRSLGTLLKRQLISYLDSKCCFGHLRFSSDAGFLLCNSIRCAVLIFISSIEVHNLFFFFFFYWRIKNAQNLMYRVVD